MRILHIAIPLESGVEAAVRSYIEHLPEHDHELLYARTGDHSLGLGPVGTELPRDLRAARSAIARAVARWRPRIVHLHSTRAGAVARTLRGLPPTVYSPHCFGFERRDVPSALRLGVLASEVVQSPATDAYFVASEHEWRLARRVSLGRRPVFLGRHSLDAARRRRAAWPPGRVRLATTGRACAQKGIDFACETAAQLRRAGVDFTWRWFGAGDRRSVERLLACGFDVTGWAPRPDVVAGLSHADLYVHTARWEAGVPIAVLEALKTGCPVLLRDIVSVREAPALLRAGDPSELAEHVRSWTRSSDQRDVVERASGVLWKAHSVEAMADSLRSAYRCVAATA